MFTSTVGERTAISTCFKKLLFVICLSTEHLLVVKNSLKCVWRSNCWFLKRQENRSTRKKTSRSKGETTNKLNPYMASTPGSEHEPGQHWWEASPLTSASLLRHHCTTTAPLLSHPLVIRATIKTIRSVAGQRQFLLPLLF